MISTHDLNLAAEHFDLVLLLNRRVVAFGTPAEVFTRASAIGGIWRAGAGAGTRRGGGG